MKISLNLLLFFSVNTEVLFQETIIMFIVIPANSFPADLVQKRSLQLNIFLQ